MYKNSKNKILAPRVPPLNSGYTGGVVLVQILFEVIKGNSPISKGDGNWETDKFQETVTINVLNSQEKSFITII